MGSQSTSGGLRWGAAVGLVLALVLGPWSARAGAEEEAGPTLRERVDEYVRQLTAMRKSEDVYRIHEEVWHAPNLYKEAVVEGAPSALQARLVKGIGMLSRHRDERVRLSAIEALGVMQHQDGAKYLKPFLKDVQENPATSLTLAAIDSAGGIRHEDLVTVLLKFVAHSPSLEATQHAVEALGHYGRVKGKRETILVEILEVTLGEQDLERWKVLARALPRSFNRLTGRDVGSLDGWLQLIDANREDLGALFPADESDS